MAGDHEPARSQLNHVYEDSIEVTFGAGIEDMEVQPQGMSRSLRVAYLLLGNSMVRRVDQKSHDSRRGDQLVQQFQPLRRNHRAQLGHARDVAARPVKVGDETELDRVAAHFEDDRNGRGRRLCCERRRSSGRGNHGHLTLNQISHHRRQPIASALRPAVFDRHGSPLDISYFLQALTECGHHGPVPVGRCLIEKPDHRLLRPRRHRPSCGRAADERDELAPPHLTHVKACICNSCCIVR